MRGTIRANHPSGQHAHGPFVFDKTPREFVVDDKAAKDLDEAGKPLVLTPATYESLRPKIGHQLAVEPLGGLDSEASAKRIADLEARVAELEALLAAATTVASPAEAPARAKK